MSDKKCKECGQTVEVNSDGDSIADMRAVQERLGDKGVTYIGWDGLPYVGGASGRFDKPLSRYRITAKHADKFDASCMEFETWARAAIGRGMVLRGEIGDGPNKVIKYADRFDWFIDGCVIRNTFDDRRGEHMDFASYAWTAITPEQHAKETQPELVKRYTRSAHTVLRDGELFCICLDHFAASSITDSLNG